MFICWITIIIQWSVVNPHWLIHWYRNYLGTVPESEIYDVFFAGLTPSNIWIIGLGSIIMVGVVFFQLLTCYYYLQIFKLRSNKKYYNNIEILDLTIKMSLIYFIIVMPFLLGVALHFSYNCVSAHQVDSLFYDTGRYWTKQFFTAYFNCLEYGFPFILILGLSIDYYIQYIKKSATLATFLILKNLYIIINIFLLLIVGYWYISYLRFVSEDSFLFNSSQLKFYFVILWVWINYSHAVHLFFTKEGKVNLEWTPTSKYYFITLILLIILIKLYFLL
jgi:hypothetical protein